MKQDTHSLHSQIIGPPFDSRRVIPLVAQFVSILRLESPEFIDQVVAADEQESRAILCEQVKKVEDKASEFYTEKVEEHLLPYIAYYDPPLKGAILQCKVVASGELVSSDPYTPSLLYALCSLVSELQKSAYSQEERGGADDAAFHANQALHFIGENWNLGRKELIIAPCYAEYEATCRHMSSTRLYDAYQRILHTQDVYDNVQSDPSFCTPLILPPSNYPTQSLPLFNHFSTDGRQFTEEHLSPSAIAAAENLVYLRYLEFKREGENNEDSTTFIFGPLKFDQGGVEIYFHGVKPLHPDPQQKEILITLAKADGNQVWKDDLIDQVWGEEATINPVNVTKAVGRLANYINEATAGEVMVERFPARGKISGWKLVKNSPTSQ